MATQQTSSSAPIRRYQLSAAASGPMASFARLSLYDGRMQLIADGYDHIGCQVPAGLYKITLKLNEGYKEQYVTVQGDQNLSIEVPETASAVIAPGFKTSHEYYTYDAQQYSSKTTADLPDVPKGNGALFLFFRYPDEMTYMRYRQDGRRLADHFQLLDEARRVISSFSPAQVREEDTRYGWMAFHTQLKPGSYYLYYSGRSREPAWNERAGQGPREVPVQVFEGWQTQGFLTFRNGPVFSSMIFSLASLAINDRLNPQVQYELTLLEGVLRKFANGIYFLPRGMLANLAARKFDNPFLGIAAAYAYFKSAAGDQEDFFSIVMINLGGLLGTESPDMRILDALAAGHDRQNPVQSAALQVPGMFAAGFSLMLRRQGGGSMPAISPGSAAERCLDRLYHDMLWTSYHPFAKPRQGPGSAPLQAASSVIDGQRRLKSISLLTHLLGRNLYRGLNVRKSHPAHSQPRKPSILNSWMAHSLAAAIKGTPEGQTPVLEALAASLQLTPNLLQDTADKLTKNSGKITAYLAARREPELTELFSTNNLQRIAQVAGRRLPSG